MIDYNAFLTGVKSPLDQAMAGYDQGVGIRKEAEKEQAIQAMTSQEGGPTAQQSLEYSLRNPEAAGVLALNAKQRALAQQAQAAVKRAEKFQENMASLSEDTAAANDTRVLSESPAMKDAIKESYEALDAESQDKARSEATSLYAAIDAGNIDVAKSIAQTKLDKAKESG